MALRPLQEDLNFLQSRFVLVIAVAAAFFLLVGIRLYYLQVLRGDEFRAFANENTLKEIRIPAVRGSLLDRHEIPIASSRPSFDLAVVPQYVQNIPRLTASLDHLLGIPSELVGDVWRKAERMPPFYPITVMRDIGFDAMAQVQVRQAIETDDLDIQGLEILARPVRRYPQSSMSAATLGYVREASREELKRLREQVPDIYHLGDTVGASGLEQRWEVLLKGQDGYQQRIVNAVGREVQSEAFASQLIREPARSGINVVTTLDHRLQLFAEDQFTDKVGALVALNPQNGEIYALVSKPTFNLNTLSGHVTSETWKQLVQDPGKVFLNRAVQSAYPPGSTYKVVVAAAALEEEVVTPEDKVYCPGYLRFGRRAFRCWKSGGHGRMDLHRAIVQSCDVFFYTMGIRLGVDRLAEYAKRFGLGQKTGLDLRSETPGLIPSSAWKEKYRGAPWYPGETLSIAIGQGYDLVSPLQNAIMIATVANGGFVVRPRLVRYFLDHNGQRIPMPGYPLLKERVSAGLSADTIARLQAAVAGVVSEPGGTAGRLRQIPVPIAGKTGTSQVVGSESKKVGDEYKDHAWFVAYAPVENPQIAVSVIVEHGGHGSSAAAPIAGAVIQKFMELKGSI